MAKYNKKFGLMIAEVYGLGTMGVEEMCTHFQISKETFYAWKRTKPEFSDAIDHFHSIRMENFGQMALSGLALLLSKHEYTEEKIDYVTVKDPNSASGSKQIVKGLSRTKKFIMPNPKMIEMTLNNRLPMYWKTSSKIDVTSNGETLGFGNFLMGTKPAMVKKTEGEEPEGEQEETYSPTHRE